MSITNMSDFTKGVTDAMTNELRDEISIALLEAIDKFKKERLPKIIASACRLLDISLTRQYDRAGYGLNINFTVMDMEEIRKAIQESS